MKYLYYSFAILFIIYVIISFKEKPNDSAFNRYYNSKYYRLLILIFFGILAAIVSLFVSKK